MKKGNVTYKVYPKYEYIFEFEDENGTIETETVIFENRKPSDKEIKQKHEEILQRKINEKKELKNIEVTI